MKGYYDPYPVYVRKRECVKKKFDLIDEMLGKWVRFPMNGYNRCLKFVVGFCGTLYPGLMINVDTSLSYNMSTIDHFCYIPEKALNVASMSLKKKDHATFWESLKDKYSSSSTREKEIYEYFEPRKNTDIFFDLKVPVFVRFGVTYGDFEGVTKNPELTRLSFQNFMDPFTCYQELSMYLGGILTDRDDPSQVTNDKVLRDSKGFDKMSFKTHSPGKKRKNK